MAATATTAAAAAQDASSSATSTTTSTDHPYLVTFIPLNPPGAPSSSTSHTRRIVNLEHPVSIGRLLDKDEPDFRGLKFASKVVSRRHAVMGFLDRKLYIQDTSSSSGTFLNSKRLSPQGTESGKVEVRDGDVIRLGEECEVNGVVHQAVTLKVALGNVTALKGRESQPGRHPSEDSDNYIDLSTNPLIQHAVDSEFTLIWSSLTRGLDHPLKKLRDAAVSASQATRTPSSISQSSSKGTNRSSSGSTVTTGMGRRPSATPPRGLVIREGEVWGETPGSVVRNFSGDSLATVGGAGSGSRAGEAGGLGQGVVSPGLRTAVGGEGVLAVEPYIPFGIPPSDPPSDELRPPTLGKQ